MSDEPIPEQCSRKEPHPPHAFGRNPGAYRCPGVTASEVSGWPDEATVERAAEAIHDADYRYECAESVQMSLDPATYFPTLARAALSGLPDPTAGTVLLDQVRQLSAEWDDRGATWCMTRIAALLAGGGE